MHLRVMFSVLLVAVAGCTTTGSTSSFTASDEQAATRETVQLAYSQVLGAYRSGHRPAHRDAHAKAQGCVKAHFTVFGTIPQVVRVGVFAHAHVYTSWIRFSDAFGTNDHLAGSHGMAIKLTGVPGLKVLPDEEHETTQDFLLVNYPIFNVRTPSEYIAFQEATDSGRIGRFFLSDPHSALISLATAAQRVSNPLYQQYYSMVPYELGAKFAKYSAEPVSCTTGRPLHDNARGRLPSDPDYLRSAMRATLSGGSSCFVFMVQLQTDPRTMPLEDPTVRWSEQESAFIPVASIVIPQQRFDSQAEQTFCENLSYTPWHALPEHRPVGWVNRIRRVVYDTISTLRHKLNGVQRREPTGNERFPGSPTW